LNSVVVLGGGESGVGAALLAQRNNMEVFVSDFGIISKEYKEELKNNNIPFEEEGHTFERIELASIIVKSPGIPEGAEVIQHFRLRQKTIISEIEFGSRFYDGKIIGVTGSNGKTTTCSLIHHVLQKLRLSVGLGGNIGNAFCRMLLEDHRYDWVILELSSFQLDDISQFKADIGVLLNITPDHLDRYDYDIEKYGRAKWRLIECTKDDGLIILNAEDNWSNKFLETFTSKAKQVSISSVKPQKHLVKNDDSEFEINLLGRHNIFNAAVAKTIAESCGLSEIEIAFGLGSFQALEHRLEKVAIVNGVTFINDSKATNVDAVEYALESISGNIIWIAGGVDKGNDYSVLKKDAHSKVKLLICLCKDDEKLRGAFEDTVAEVETTESTKEAVRIAIDKSEKGDVVLLSPACASFDLFDNYKHRGEVFKKEVFNILSEYD